MLTEDTIVFNNEKGFYIVIMLPPIWEEFMNLYRYKHISRQGTPFIFLLKLNHLQSDKPAFYNKNGGGNEHKLSTRLSVTQS